MNANQFFINPENIELIDGEQKRDDGSFFGGIQYIGETLDNLLGECEIDFNKCSIEELLNVINECNVKIKKINEVIKKIILWGVNYEY